MRPTNTPRGAVSVYQRGGVFDPVLHQGYEACQRAARTTEIEYAVSQLLPAPLRLAAWAVYGAARAVDDLVDVGADGAPAADRAARLEEWIAAFDADLRSGASTDPVRQALIHTMLTWSLPPSSMYLMFGALRGEAAGRQLATWQEWRDYSSLAWASLAQQIAWLFLKAAGVSTEPEALATAMPETVLAWQTMVDALHVTDALADLAEDLTRGHVSLPQEALDEAGVRRADLLNRRSTVAFESMVRRLAGQAHAGLGAATIPDLVHPLIKIPLDAYAGLYRLRLETVVGDPAALLHRRPVLPSGARRRLLAPARIRAALAWTLFPFPFHPGTTEPVLPVAPAPSTSSTGTGTVRPGDDVRTHWMKQPRADPTPHPSGARPPRLPDQDMPRHVAIIMDGNGRWATARGLPRAEGHRAGGEALIDVLHGALEIGLQYLTVYGFSTENWKRPTDELHTLMSELVERLRRLKDDCPPLDVRVRWAGLHSPLSPDMIDALTAVEHTTQHCRALTLTACVNYGGRAEITRAATRLAHEVAAGRLRPASISEHSFARYLHIPDLPDVDLLLRTGGDQRTSNFLPWQAAYAELVFLDTLWPDMDRRDLWRAVEQYAVRDRRYGSVPPPRPGVSRRIG
ncbi:polyprenyl diphosphate synthase [Streptomyces zagrosensis]|uniref:Isoprenyl transferase n=1 Tax=Streptomyces zagrosensis TaxID=1042984 RepID=A0A7W9QCC4_9ACTN|nr:polyprenyl diphosphate synthase [Streptomyces zagrosensis]MBB5936412.1 undecaprenyl diphosphate synthase [Streptomyces zagrosensis]